MMNPLSSQPRYNSRLGSNFNPGPQQTGGMPATAASSGMAPPAQPPAPMPMPMVERPMPPAPIGPRGRPTSYGPPTQGFGVGDGPPSQFGGGRNFHQGMLPPPVPTIGPPGQAGGQQGPPPGMVYSQAGGGNANYMGPPAQMGGGGTNHGGGMFAGGAPMMGNMGRPDTFYGSQQTGGQYQPPQQPQQPQQGFQTPRQWSPPTGANFRTMGPRAL